MPFKFEDLFPDVNHIRHMLPLLVVLMMFCAVLIVFYNVPVLTNTYLLSLFVAQMMIGGVGIPLYILRLYASPDGLLGLLTCRLGNFLLEGFSLVSVFSVTGIAMVVFQKTMSADLHTTHPEDFSDNPEEEDQMISTSHAQQRRRGLRESANISVVWTVSFLYAIRSLILMEFSYDPRALVVTNTCMVAKDYIFIEKYLTIVDFCVELVLPLAITTNCYARVVEKMSMLIQYGFLTNDQIFYTSKMCLYYTIIYSVMSMPSRITFTIMLWYGRSPEPSNLVLTDDGVLVDTSRASVQGLIGMICTLLRCCVSWMGVFIVCYFTHDYKHIFKHLPRCQQGTASSSPEDSTEIQV